MLPSPAPRYYLVGTVLAAVGAVVALLRAWRRGKPTPRPWVRILVGIVLIIVGAAVVAYGILVDNQYKAGLSTTVMNYDVSVRMNGTWPVRILLPAPSDARLFDALNVTNGSASLALNHTAAQTNVVLTTHGNVTFRIRATVPTAEVSQSFSRVSPGGPNPCYSGCNATVELTGVPAGAKVFLSLAASIGVTCVTRTLSLEAWISEGVAQYPAVTPMMVC